MDRGDARPKRSKPRPGTANKGQEYEILLPALFSLRFLTDPSIKKFTLMSNVRDFGAFDDLVVVLEFEDRREKYAFQLKHKETRNRAIHPESLEEGRNDFSIVKYFEDFRNVADYHLIMYTNAYFNFDFDKLKKFEVEKIGPSPGREHFFLPSSHEAEKADIHKFKPAEATPSSFFDRFDFYTSQKDWQEVQEQVIQTFNRLFCINDSSVAMAYINIFKFWKLHEFSHVELTKAELETKIMDLVLSPYMVPPSTTQDEGFVSLERAISEFDVTIINGPAEVPLLAKSYFGPGEDVLRLAKDMKLLCKQVKKFANGKQESEITERICYYTKEKPIVVKIHDANRGTVLATIARLKRQHKLHFVLLGEVRREELPNLGVLESLEDLLNRDEHIYNDLTKKMKILVRAKTYTYHELFGKHPELSQNIKIGDVVEMLKGTRRLETMEESPTKPYVSREVSTSLFRIDALTEIQNDLLVISCRNHQKVLKHMEGFVPRKFQPLDEYLYQDTPETNLVVYKPEVSAQEFKLVCDRDAGRSVHHLAIHSDEFLEWVSTSNNIQELRNCEVVKTPTIHESQIYDKLQNSVNVIVARPGTGKSEILKQLINKCPLGFFPIKITLKEHDLFFSTCHTDDEILNHFLTSSGEGFLLFEAKKSLARKRRIFFFFDGLDELRSENIKIALHHIRRLSEMGFKIWLTSRPYYQKDIEDFLNVFPVDLRSFNEEEQKLYIRERLRGRKNLDKIVDHIFMNVAMMVENRDILDIPLQLWMITEILLNQPAEVSNSMFVLTRMFRSFHLGRYRHYFDKNKCGHWSCLEKIVDDSVKYRSKQYQIAALKSCLNRNEFQSLNLEQDSEFLNQVKTEGDFLGIISKITHSDVIFNHNTTCTYFVGLWLAENRQRRQFLQEVIFKKEYTHIRLMFDMILSEDSPSHVAVLYRNLEALKGNQERIQDLDKGKRSALHLACSNYCKYSTLEEILEPGKIESVREADKKCRPILEFLVKEGLDPFLPDSVLGLTCLQFAQQTDSLLAFDVILQTTPDAALNLEGEEKLAIPHSCIVLSYPQLFKKVCQRHLPKQINYFLHLAATWNSLEILVFLLDHGADVHSTTTSKKADALQLASAKGHIEIVNLLLFRGADVDGRDTFGRSPLHLAAQNGHLLTAKRLIQGDAKVDAFDNYGLTPLHLAVEKAHQEVIAFLVDEQGAKINRIAWSGWAPLHLAIVEGHLKIVDMLLERGADVHQVDKYGTKPVHLAAKYATVEMVDTLLAKCGVDDLTGDGKTSLLLAAEGGKVQIVERLLKKKADVNVCDGDAKSALVWAIIGQHCPVVKLLLSYKINTELVDSNGRNALQWACMVGDSTIVEALLPKMSKLVNGQDRNGGTPLHWAANGGHNDIIRLLLNAGALIDIEDHQGRTPLYWSALEGQPATVELLLDKKARKVSICGKSALDYARDRTK